MTNQKKIKHFLEVIEIKSKDSDSHNELADNGLIIVEKEKSEISSQDVLKELPEGRCRSISIINAQDYESFINAFSIANREGQYLLVDLQCDPHPNIISILKQISEGNEASILTYKDREEYLIKLNPKTRIIFYGRRELFEDQITYPHFYDLFGPILSL